MYKKVLLKAFMLITSGFIVIAENNMNFMCGGFFDEIELPAALEHPEHLK